MYARCNEILLVVTVLTVRCVYLVEWEDLMCGVSFFALFGFPP